MNEQVILPCGVLCGFMCLALWAAPVDSEWNSAAFETRSVDVLVSGGQERNAVFSPYSLAFALGMLGEGAEGAPREAIARTLGSTTNFAATFGPLMNAIGTGSPLAVANSVWIRDPRLVKPAYVRTLAASFRAEVAPLKGVEPINAWAKKKTDGLIPKVLDTLDAQAAAVLVNAVVFHGKWTVPFEKERTTPQDFTAVDGKRRSVSMMHDTRWLPVVTCPAYRATRLDYQGGGLSMWIILPEAGRTLADVRKQLTAQAVNRLDKMFAPGADGADVSHGDVILAVPRFKVESSYDLKPALATLGVPLGPGSFLRINPDFEVGAAVQKAMIEVDEEGTKAAAVTAIMMKCTSVGPASRPVEFICDHPFIFLVRDDVHHLSLFAGQYCGEDNQTGENR